MTSLSDQEFIRLAQNLYSSFRTCLSSYTQHPPFHNIFRENYNSGRLRRYFVGLLVICIVATVYMNVSKLQGQFNNCKPFPWINSNVSHLRPSRGPPYLAYILSSTVQRFNNTFLNLKRVLPDYFSIHYKQSVSKNDSRIFRHGDVQVSSLLLTYIDMWMDFGSRPEAEFTDNDWIFLFEDDVNIVPMSVIEAFHPKIYLKWRFSNLTSLLPGIIEEGLKMAKDDGVLYLGTCGPEYVDNITTARYSKDGAIQFRRGVYFCTHAVAYTKWRARRIWSDFAAYKFLHNEVGSDTIARQWKTLSKTYPICVASNIHWPPGTGHYGFFYQDRGAVPSLIQG